MLSSVLSNLLRDNSILRERIVYCDEAFRSARFKSSLYEACHCSRGIGVLPKATRLAGPRTRRGRERDRSGVTLHSITESSNAIFPQGNI